MKTLLLIVLISLSFIDNVFAQNPLTLDIRSKKKEVIYLKLNEKNKMEYVVSNNDLDNTKSVDAKDNSINIYVKWLNPLKYKLSWKDSTQTDERDKAISDFINLLVAQFGTPISAMNTPSGLLPNSPGSTDSSEITGIKFNDNQLLLLLIQLRANQKYLSNAEIFNINKLTESLKELDDLDAFDVSDAATKIYSTMFEYKDLKDYNDDFSFQQSIVVAIGKKFEMIEDLRKDIAEKLKALSIKDEMLNRFTQAIVSGFLDKSLTDMNANKKIITKLKPVLEIMNNSTANESLNPITKGYFKNRSAEFDNGSKLESSLTVTEFEFNKESKEFTKKSDILNKTFVFRRYEPVDVSVSSGLFWANTTLKGFGVSNDGTDFKVTEDDINNNTAVVALFLDINFKVSRYFSPLVQIGIDPTKKKPFLLFGAGFSIPIGKKQIAFSGGKIWTWNQGLDKLQVGQTITSTTDLEKDIKYTFDAEPKGWYAGIQYNF